MIVNALAGDRVAPGVTVVSHAADGTVIDQVAADDSGRASLRVDDDALVSVVFPAVIEPSTTVHVVTTLAPDAELTVYGPADSSEAAPVVGVLNVNGPALPDAEWFDIDFGCTHANVASLPATIDVRSCSLGSDDQVDVLVRAAHSIGGDLSFALDGYAAGRVSLVNGAVSFDIGAWETATTNAPVTVDAAGASVELRLYSDGLPFGTQDLTDHADLWKGLVVDATQVAARIHGDQGERLTIRDFDGVPDAVTFAEADFLTEVAPTITLASLNPLSLRWDETRLGDAVDLHATWKADGVNERGGTVWDAILPPEATTITFPAFVDELAIATSRGTIESDHVLLQYVDSPAYDGFAALAADGVRVLDEYVHVPETNTLRMSRVWGPR